MRIEDSHNITWINEVDEYLSMSLSIVDHLTTVTVWLGVNHRAVTVSYNFLRSSVSVEVPNTPLEGKASVGIKGILGALPEIIGVLEITNPSKDPLKAFKTIDSAVDKILERAFDTDFKPILSQTYE